MVSVRPSEQDRKPRRSWFRSQGRWGTGRVGDGHGTSGSSKGRRSGHEPTHGVSPPRRRGRSLAPPRGPSAKGPRRLSLRTFLFLSTLAPSLFFEDHLLVYFLPSFLVCSLRHLFDRRAVRCGPRDSRTRRLLRSRRGELVTLSPFGAGGRLGVRGVESLPPLR